MCKITFSNLKENNEVPKGLLQLMLQEEHIADLVSDSKFEKQEELTQDSFDKFLYAKNEQTYDQIVGWFEKKHIVLGNPEDKVYENVQKQKAIIIPKKKEINAVSGTNMKMNNLLARRAAKLIEVNVSG